jgi:hypothetical protein
VAYGPGGGGKTELCSLLKHVGVEPLFLDIENGSAHLDVARIGADELVDFEAVRSAINNSELCKPFGAIVVDSLTKLEELAVRWTIKNVPHPEKKEKVINSIEDYGFGKGYQFVYETFLLLLGDLDKHVREGRHVICTAHDCTSPVPNPTGEDWIRYEPRLQSPSSGKSSIRLRVKEWCDHLLFIGYDVFVGESGKGTGVGTRTIYPTERPALMAKSRSLATEIPYAKGSYELWTQLLKG